MTVTELIQLVSYKLSSLNSARSTALSAGDLARIVALDSEILETQTTLDQLKGL